MATRDPQHSLPEPYQGLRPYEEKDQDRFFGRDIECRILVDKILANRLTLLFAASGVGKSSLLQAAVLPRLKDPKQENLDAVYYNDWVSPPLEGLRKAVLGYLRERQYIDSDPPLPENDLKALLGLAALFTRQPLILILDQFEEFFRYRRRQPDFQGFIEQLARTLLDREIPVAVVISMREDFALELNAFKPHLPTLLFDNYYRLERLSQDNARLAMVTPLEPLGFHYEDELLETLLKDLSRREAGHLENPVADWMDTVEPAYVQIICSQLWEWDRGNPGKTLRFATYRAQGGCEGLLQAYVQRVLDRFGRSEKLLASRAFNHLITQRGAKMAYTAERLARLIDAEPGSLARVLERLEQGRILRSQSRQGEQWYELYHDIFSAPLERWNQAFKQRERIRGGILGTLAALGVGALLFATYDGLTNYTSHQLRLSVKSEVSDEVELYRGKAGSFDLFGLQAYEKETGTHRSRMEPDKFFLQRPVADFADLEGELIGTLPLVERVSAYWQDGEIGKALELAEKSISNDDTERAKSAIDRLGDFRSILALYVLDLKLRAGNLNAPIKFDISDALGPGRLGRAEAVAPLLALLKDSDDFVRQSAADALGGLGGAEAVAPLVALLKDSDDYVRRTAAEALGRLGQTHAIEPLLEYWASLEHSNSEVSEEERSAMLAITLLGSPEAIPIAEGLWGKDSGDLAVAAVIAAAGRKEASAVLTEAARSTSSKRREELAEVLGQAPAKEPAIGLLEELSNDPVWSVQLAAIESLGQLAAHSVISRLKVLAANPSNLNLQRAALESLARIDAKEATAAILASSSKDDAPLPPYQYQLLGKLQAKKALPLLTRQLRGLEEEQQAWRKIRDEVRDDFTDKQIEAWKQRLEQARPRGFHLVAHTLARIDPETTGFALLAHDQSRVREGAALGLGQVGSPALLESLYQLWLKADDPLVRHARYRAIDHVLIRLQSFGMAEDLQALKAFYAKFPEPIRDCAVHLPPDLSKPLDRRCAVATRTEWTLNRLEETLDATKPTPVSPNVLVPALQR